LPLFVIDAPDTGFSLLEAGNDEIVALIRPISSSAAIKGSIAKEEERGGDFISPYIPPKG
jgi:hypothetical protein